MNKKKMFSGESPARSGEVDILNPGSAEAKGVARQSPLKGRRSRDMFQKMISFAAVAGLVLAMAPASHAGLVGQLGVLDEAWFLANPDNPGTSVAWEYGDTYHLVFFTSTTRNATSSDIGVYNAFVQAAADAAGIGSLAGVTWNAIGSTATVNARDNALVSAPVYTMNAELVATGYVDIWDGTIKVPLNWNEKSELLTSGPPYWRVVWTGTSSQGTPQTPLGSGKPSVGFLNMTDIQWIYWSGGACPKEELHRLYALSEPLQVVPEPATMALLGLGGLGLILGRKRR